MRIKPEAGFGEMVRRGRVSLGLTQSEFGLSVGVDGNTISSWETGRAAPGMAKRAFIEGRLREMIGMPERAAPGKRVGPGRVSEGTAVYGPGPARIEIHITGSVELRWAPPEASRDAAE